MRLPAAPNVNPLKQISPSIYEALLQCRARAAWAASSDKRTAPQHPKAVLGACLHAVVEEAHKGALAGKDGKVRLAAARKAFDEHAALLYKEAHPLLRAKFSAPERLPYYNLYRERAAMEAALSADRVGRAATAAASASPAGLANVHAERKLVSQDGLLVGRPDLIDAAAGQVVDYKTGISFEEAPGAVSQSEGRQLRLYIHLAHENGLSVSRAVIARADGRRASIDVSKAEADAEGHKARELLAQYNAEAGPTFQDAAQASPEACRFCPCIPFCEAFWQAASPSWSEQCGVHLEGQVESVDEATMQGMRLMTLRVRVRRGTVAAEEAFVEHLPVAWITCDGSSAPRKEDVLRVVHAHRAGEDSPALIRVDRTATSVWTTAGQEAGVGG
jgi:RecB family exonuclease